MKAVRRSLALLVVTLAGAATPVLADVIHLTDGKSLEDVTVVDDTIKEVSYRDAGSSSTKTVSSDKVLRIEFEKVPRLISEAEGMVTDGAFFDAIDRMQLFVDGKLSGENRGDRQKWAVPLALYRIIELQLSLGELDDAVKACDKLIENAPESRFLPYAYLAKAEAQRYLGKESAALATLDEFRAKIDELGLSELWRLEAELAGVLTDPKLTGTKKRDRLIEIGSTAGSQYPVVRNRARVAEGESYIEGEKKDFAAARAVFEKITSDPKADDATLAGAYTGLGDCLFQSAVDEMKQGGASENLAAAVKAYMRVVVSYKDQTRYVPKAMFFAARVFDFMESTDEVDYKARARKLYTAVLRDFPNSPWAAEAKKFR